MAKNVVFYGFRGNEMCFTHLLINAIDMHENGINARIIIEGEATKTAKEMMEKNHKMFTKAKDLGLIDGVCKACSNQMGVLDFFENTDLKILGDLYGHPSLTPYIKDDFEVIVI